MSSVKLMIFIMMGFICCCSDSDYGEVVGGDLSIVADLLGICSCLCSCSMCKYLQMSILPSDHCTFGSTYVLIAYPLLN